MTKHLHVILCICAILIASCSATTDESIPTEIGLPTTAPTSAPTQTAEPTDIPEPIPTELFYPNTVAQVPADQAYLRSINASDELGILDVYIEALAIATNLDYGSFTEREGIEAGRYTLRILPTGSFLTDTALYEETFNIFGGESLVLVLSGTVENMIVTRLAESNQPLPNDTSRLMMVNAVTGGDDMVMLVNDTPQTAITPYLQISEITTHPARRVTLKFQNAGNLLIEQEFDLRERENYTFAVVGDVAQPDSIQLLILTSSAPGLTDVSIINASQSIGLVDIYFSGELFRESANYAENSPPIAILSGTYDISVYPEGANPDDIDPLTGTQFIANPDELVALVLIGEPNSLQFAIYRSNKQPTYDNQARIAFLNSLENVPSIILNSTDESFNQRLTYGRFSPNTQISTERGYGFTWIQQVNNDQDIALESVDNFTPIAGNNYLYIFAGRGFDTPVLLSYEVGTLGFATVEESDIDREENTAPASRPAQVRFLNLVEGQQFNIRVDGTMVAEAIDYPIPTNELVINSGERAVLFSEAIDDFEVAEITTTYDIAQTYSVIIYDNPFDPDMPIDVIRIDDTGSIITQATSGIRLIILEAQADSTFGIGYSEPFADLSQPLPEEDFRRSLPIGIDQIIRKIPDGNVSDIQRVPSGTYNINIIDNEEAALTFTHTSFTLEPETLYNVFLWEDDETGQTNTIIVPFSSASG